MRFGAFVMTYERTAVLGDTLAKILSQTLPPEKILVVDCGETFDTQHLIESMNNPQIEYHRIGYNAGPAGAAKIGLKRLASEGYNWIYWGDDDDPPLFPDTFEILFGLIDEQPIKPGIVGAVGHYFNVRRGEIDRVPDEELKRIKTIKIDSIAGNQSMIVNAQVVAAGVLPEEKLFFGFEELDFCLKVKKAGFDLLVSTTLFLQSRVRLGKVNYTRPRYIVKEERQLKRQYYSTRNILSILKARKYYRAYAYQLVKAIGKSFYGFRYGLKYGYTNFRMIEMGILHSFMGRYGKYF